MSGIFLGNAMELWWNPIILLTGDASSRYLSGFEMVSVDVRETIVGDGGVTGNCVRNSVVSEVLDQGVVLTSLRGFMHAPDSCAVF